MNPNQRDHFLWTWSRQRKRGRLFVLAFGAGIGALGGVAFGAIMLYAMGGPGNFSFNEDEFSPWLLAFANLIGPTAFLFLCGILAFGLVGAIVSDRVWRMQENLYHSLAAQGARMPVTKPTLRAKDRWPHLAVLGFFVLLAIWLIGMLIWEIERGNL